MSREVAGWGKEGRQTGLSKWGCFQAKPIRRCFPPWSSNNQSHMCEQATWPISQQSVNMFTAKSRLKMCKLKTKQSLIYYFVLPSSTQNFSQSPQRSYFVKSKVLSLTNPYSHGSKDPSEKLSLIESNSKIFSIQTSSWKPAPGIWQFAPVQVWTWPNRFPSNYLSKYCLYCWALSKSFTRRKLSCEEDVETNFLSTKCKFPIIQ